ncbi:hypothetical protein AAHA92_00150 [Salvia divinorum]|uniref:Uncharacterized protein n=1 Tax=Salvia divinorum TaxID=28513 RepID=A0ABD1ILC9_SALDI
MGDSGGWSASLISNLSPLDDLSSWLFSFCFNLHTLVTNATTPEIEYRQLSGNLPSLRYITSLSFPSLDTTVKELSFKVRWIGDFC